jgi:hypothetical protein
VTAAPRPKIDDHERRLYLVENKVETLSDQIEGVHEDVRGTIRRLDTLTALLLDKSKPGLLRGTWDAAGPWVSKSVAALLIAVAVGVSAKCGYDLPVPAAPTVQHPN